jgi:hypothetical protein
MLTRPTIDDGKLSTAWVAGNKNDGIGETINFTFKREIFKECDIRDSINFDGFRIVTGYAKDSMTWKANSRVKTVRVFHNNKPICDIVLQDCMLIQDAKLDNPVYIKPDDRITVMIMTIYPGDKYHDTAISELIPLGAH